MISWFYRSHRFNSSSLISPLPSTLSPRGSICTSHLFTPQLRTDSVSSGRVRVCLYPHSRQLAVSGILLCLFWALTEEHSLRTVLGLHSSRSLYKYAAPVCWLVILYSKLFSKWAISDPISLPCVPSLTLGPRLDSGGHSLTPLRVSQPISAPRPTTTPSTLARIGPKMVYSRTQETDQSEVSLQTYLFHLNK